MGKWCEAIDQQIVEQLDKDIEPAYVVLDNKSYMELAGELKETDNPESEIGTLPEAYAGCEIVSIPYPTEFFKVVPKANTVAYLELNQQPTQ